MKVTLLFVCLKPVLQACDLLSTWKGRLDYYIVGYPKHKGWLGDNGDGWSSYFERRIRLFVKVIKQVAGREQGLCTLWELACSTDAHEVRQVRGGRRGPRGSQAHLACAQKPNSL